MSAGGGRKHPRLGYENRLILLVLAGGAPGVVIVLALLWTGQYSTKVQWTLSLLVVSCWIVFAFAVRERIVRPLQTTSNIMGALREGDYSLRAHGSKKGDALSEVYREINELSTMLHEQRLGALEATNLLRTVMAEIDVAIFAFDASQRLRLVNRAGERLLDQPAERLTGRTASELGLAQCLSASTTEPVTLTFRGSTGRWGVRVSQSREGGRPHQLLVLTDLTRTLRAEEVSAWKRIVRVLGHELNNSLTPIKSIANSLTAILGREALPEDWRQDLTDGLAVISGRSESLSRFMGAYTRLARLPEPKLSRVDVGEWVTRVAGLETRLPIAVEAGAPMTVQGDADQLEQLLINLVRNAVEAARETGGGVRAGWRRVDSQVEVWIQDDGPGLASTANLFVPFYTTKPGGSGIGLVLSRQIAEAHKGAITLENRSDGRGCEARLRLPAG